MSHTHNYADNYCPEILTLQSSEPPLYGYVQNIPMPTLQEMHQRTAASLRSTVKLFLLLEELSYRHLYRVDAAQLGNFKIRSATGALLKEDDFASNGLRGLADFVASLFRCMEAQARGFAHGHGKGHSIPDGTRDLLQCLDGVVQEIEDLQAVGGGPHPADDVRSRSWNWKFADPVTGATLTVKRSQLPLMPASACPLYSLQGMTCDPGLIANFAMPRRADDDIKWLIVYVLLSRVRSLACLRSFGLTPRIRKIIETLAQRSCSPTTSRSSFETRLC